MNLKRRLYFLTNVTGHWPVIAILLIYPFFSRSEDSFLGKNPWAELPSEPSSIAAPASDAVTRQISDARPLPFVTIENAITFIRDQRKMGRGLPPIFRVPSNVTLTDPSQNLISREGSGLYDNALAAIVFIEHGNLSEAGQILDFYIEGSYAPGAIAPMELRAFPSPINNFSFEPFEFGESYFFNFTNSYGDWTRWRENWKFWATHTGPNAWMINAAVRLALAYEALGQTGKARPYRDLAIRLGKSMRRLQDPKAQGAVRYGPQGVWHRPEYSDPFEELNTENNLSAYTAFRMLRRMTADSTWDQAADDILKWFQFGDVTTEGGSPRKGLMDEASGTLAMGAVRTHGKWQLQKARPTDAGGTWAISCLGAETIDRFWGKGAAWRMWSALRKRAGRTAAFEPIREGEPLAGFDFNDHFSVQETLISPEWTAGALLAATELLRYYSSPAAQNAVSPEALASLRRDRLSMRDFLKNHSTHYALGPGFHGTRKGETGFGWICPPPEASAISAVYVSLALDGERDPLAWWRRE